MEIYEQNAKSVVDNLGSFIDVGLTSKSALERIKKYGENKLTKQKKKGFFRRLIECLTEPMILILLFSFALAFGTKLGEFLKTGDRDFSECIGILLAIILSISITLIMEGSSSRAFSALEQIYDSVSVKVIRDNKVIIVNQKFITVGDIILLESGDKIIADGRLIESNDLKIDESSLTGESQWVEKNAQVILQKNTPLLERKNCCFSGTFVSSGSGKMVVTSVGDNTEIGQIAGHLLGKNSAQSPLNKKLSKLGKTISILGASCAILVFLISLIRLSLEGDVCFNSVQDLFVSCIILIVAAVPEGLPTIVALSLALNMIKLAKENALIKKMIATETAGAVSVICSDKTGTLTKNQMTLISFISRDKEKIDEKNLTQEVVQNFICNSTAELIKKGDKFERIGSGTECALLSAISKSSIDYAEYRKSYRVVDRLNFTSENKYMITAINDNRAVRFLLKGAPEKVLDMTTLLQEEKVKILAQITRCQQNAERVLCVAHYDVDKNQNIPTIKQTLGSYVYDGFVTLKDPIRREVKKAIKDCKRAKIKVKILTGDNRETAYAIARELDVCQSEKQVINGSEIEKMTDRELMQKLSDITVIARSTPLVKLRIVEALKKMGEVVAVTGDGINDAPALKNADVGFSMGISGSEIAKEASDVILLDDSFNTVVKAISFGRNVYRNLQRFILFQLSVNLSALIFITTVAILGLSSPFNTLQLLWINVIMDGPPALTLGLSKADGNIMEEQPVSRESSIVNFKMLIKIAFNGLFIGGVVLLQYLTNFLCVTQKEQSSVIFTLFIFFQLFNAFNSRELGAQSILKGMGKNKIMAVTFLVIFLVHLFITQVWYGLFNVNPLSVTSIIKCLALSSSIVIVSEIYKTICRKVKKIKIEKGK